MVTEDEVKRLRAADRDELLKHAQTVDLAALVESNLRVDETARRLNKILIILNLVLVILTVVLVGLTGWLVYLGLKALP